MKLVDAERIVLDRPANSNLGYGIVERIIDGVSGRNYEEFMRREIVLALGLEQRRCRAPRRPRRRPATTC